LRHPLSASAGTCRPARWSSTLLGHGKSAGTKPTTCSSMGMGEPLHNLDEVVRALRIFEHPWVLGCRPDASRFDRRGRAWDRCLAKIQPAPNLGPSRSTPRPTKYATAHAHQPALEYCHAAGRRAPLFPWPTTGASLSNTFCSPVSNDSDMDAARLPRLLRGIPSKVNIIPYNPVPRPALREPQRTAGPGLSDGDPAGGHSGLHPHLARLRRRSGVRATGARADERLEKCELAAWPRQDAPHEGAALPPRGALPR